MLNNLMGAILGPSFKTRLGQIQRETGWVQISDSRFSGLFAIPYCGLEYELWIENSDPIVKLSLMSHGRFALRLYPPVLESVLRRRNEELERFAWLFFDATRTTWARLCCSVDMNAWNATFTRSIVEEMLPEVHRYDSGLRAKGLM